VVRSFISDGGFFFVYLLFNILPDCFVSGTTFWFCDARANYLHVWICFSIVVSRQTEESRKIAPNGSIFTRFSWPPLRTASEFCTAFEESKKRDENHDSHARRGAPKHVAAKRIQTAL
jgi:hypothetical protein